MSVTDKIMDLDRRISGQFAVLLEIRQTNPEAVDDALPIPWDVYAFLFKNFRRAADEFYEVVGVQAPTLPEGTLGIGPAALAAAATVLASAGVLLWAASRAIRTLTERGIAKALIKEGQTQAAADFLSESRQDSLLDVFVPAKGFGFKRVALLSLAVFGAIKAVEAIQK